MDEKINKLSTTQIKTRERFLLKVTSLPVAPGHELAVMKFVEGWVRNYPGLVLNHDKSGNLLVARKDFKKACRKKKPLFITAHMDHPAFVVISVDGREVKLEFRGGVHDPYFNDTPIEIFNEEFKKSFIAKIVSLNPTVKPFKTVMARLDKPGQQIKAGCIGRWKFPGVGVKKGMVFAHACDDLACIAAALVAFEDISLDRKLGHVALLFTRAEEIGFVGAIGAARGGTIPKGSRLICLECSRSFPHDSPIGSGPIVRVGDRLSVFTPELTNALSSIATSHQKNFPGFRFQRKLMAGGVCEATAFSSYNFSSSCLCLALGNYHNMVDVDTVLSGKKEARVAHEFISASDFHGLVELLGTIAINLDKPGPTQRDSAEEIWAERAGILGPVS